MLNLRKPVHDAEGLEYKIVSIGPEVEDGKERPPVLRPRVGGAGMAELLLPDTLVDLGAASLAKCTKLETLELPESLRHIGACAFEGCTGLRRIVIPKNVDFISDDRVFMNCDRLEAIDVEPGNEVYQSVDGVLFTRKGQQLVGFPPGRGGRYEVPDGVPGIPGHTFVNCRGLREIVLPPSVKEIGRHAFASCTGLTNVVFRGDVRPRIDSEAFKNAGVRFP